MRERPAARVGQEGAWLLLLTLLGLAVRVPGLAGDLWVDEIATATSFVRSPLGKIVSSYSANNHVLYSVLAHLSVGLLGDSAWAFRLPALLFGAATVPALYYLARHWLPRAEALAGALLLAVSYHHAYFSQNARGYTGYLFFAVLSTAFLARALDGGRRHHWVGFALSAAAGVYVFLSGLFVLAGQFLGGLLVAGHRGKSGEERSRSLRSLVAWFGLAFLLTAALHAPLAAPAFEFFTTADADVGWRPSPELLRVILRDTMPSLDPWLWGAILLLGLPVVLTGCADLLRRAPLLVVALGLPPFLELAAALLLGAGTYPRRFLLLLPLAILAFIRGSGVLARRVEAIRRRPARGGWAFAALVGAAVVGAAAGLPRLWAIPKQDFTGALAFVEARRAPEDILAGAYVADAAARYYEPEVRSARTSADLQALLSEGRTVWLLSTLEGDMARRAPRLRALVKERFRVVATFPGLVGDGEVVVWRSRNRLSPAPPVAPPPHPGAETEATVGAPAARGEPAAPEGGGDR